MSKTIMKASLLLKRLFGGGIIFLGLLWFASLPWIWGALRPLKLGALIYGATGICCLITGMLILRLTRQRLLATSLGAGLLWSLAMSACLVSFTHVRTYSALVSEVPQDMVRVELSQTHWLLERLRAGDTNAAIGRLEGQLQSDIVRLEMVPVPERKTNTIRVLERARAYRATYPRPEGRASVEQPTQQWAQVDSQFSQ